MKYGVEILVLTVVLVAAVIGGVIEILSQNYESAIGIAFMSIVPVALIIGLWKVPQSA